MRRSIIAAAVALVGLFAALDAPAADFGIIGGYTSSKTKISQWAPKNADGYHFGVALNVPVVAGIVIQPQLTYQVKKADVSGTIADPNVNSVGTSSVKTSANYLEGGIQLQWGPDLLLFRPYVFAEPFIGYALSSKSETSTDVSFKDAVYSLEYGLGVGGGIEIGRFQLSAKYFWNFGDLYDGDELNEYADQVKSAVKDQKSFQGVSLTLGIFF